MTYEYNQAGDLWLLSDLAEELLPEELYLVPAEVYGMNPLDYSPNTDDYEYQQSRYY